MFIFQIQANAEKLTIVQKFENMSHDTAVANSF